MSSFEELMKERRKLQKEMAEKSALEAYRKKLAATYDLPSVTVTTDRAPTSTMLSMASPDIPDMGVPSIPDFEIEKSSTDVILAPMATEPAIEFTSQSVTESLKETDEIFVASTPMPEMVTSSISISSTEMAITQAEPLATSPMPVYTTTPFKPSKPTLKDVQDRIYKERGAMFDERPLPIDPEDSRRLATPASKANRRRGGVVTPSPISPDLVALQRELEEKRKMWMAKLENTEMAKKKKDMATLVYEEAKNNTPSTVVAPILPFNHDLVTHPLATDLHVPVLFGPDSKATKGESTSLVLDMSTNRGIAITAGLVGVGKFV